MVSQYLLPYVHLLEYALISFNFFCLWGEVCSFAILLSIFWFLLSYMFSPLLYNYFLEFDGKYLVQLPKNSCVLQWLFFNIVSFIPLYIVVLYIVHYICIGLYIHSTIYIVLYIVLLFKVLLVSFYFSYQS